MKIIALEESFWYEKLATEGTAPLAPADQERVAHVNAERILRLDQ